MLSGSCPSCGSPLRFQHAAAPAVVCGSCQSTVVRTDLDELVLRGKVAAFGRDLSPLRIGTSGRVGNRRFELVGVLRKGRGGVRWNEWFAVYDDGGHAWLGEGHGVLQLYEDDPQRAARSAFAQLSPGSAFEAGDRAWVVLEVAEAKVMAAEGSLPFAVSQDEAWPYADLRSKDGSRVGTLDGADGDCLLYTGRVVPFSALELEGLRPITGWSDEVDVNFEGPEVEGSRKLVCPACQAPLELRAPGSSARVACEYCGSELSLAEVAGDIAPAVLEARSSPAWKPRLELGGRGKLGGTEYAIIGAMRRGVRWGGQVFAWTEYFLYNPYVGTAFLVEDGGGHYMLVTRIQGFPRANPRGSNSVVYQDTHFRHFQSGKAEVMHVLGEFDWEVRTGETADTSDYVEPPLMMSLERTGAEIAWSRGEYLEHEVVEEAFKAKLPTPRGVAPAQPNPFKRPAAWVSTLAQLGGLGALVLLFWAFNTVMADNDVLVAERVRADLNADQVELSSVFEVPDRARRSLHVAIDTDISRDAAKVNVALINKETGRAYLPVDTNLTNKASGWVNKAEPGPYVLRVEVATASASSLTGKPGTATVTVTHDKPWHLPYLLGLLFALLAPVLLLISRTRFETRRWAESDHA